MQLSLTINLDNDAFNAPNGNEIAVILRRLAKLVDTQDLHEGYRQALMDTNGNKVGEATVTE
jgi:hypothetical protein